MKSQFWVDKRVVLFLFLQDAMECAAESGGLLDLADYCQRQLVFLSTCSSSSSSSEILDTVFDAKLSMQGDSETDLEVSLSFVFLSTYLFGCYSIVRFRLLMRIVKVHREGI